MGFYKCRDCIALDFYLFEGRDYNKLTSSNDTTLLSSRGNTSLRGADGRNDVKWLELKPTIAQHEECGESWATMN